MMMMNDNHGGGSEEDNRNWCWGLVVDDAGVGGGDGAHIDEDGAHKEESRSDAREYFWRSG